MPPDLLTAASAPTSGVLVACLPGGGIAPSYFDAQVPGAADHSLMNALSARGHAVASLALPGTLGIPPAGDGGLEAAATSLVSRIEELRGRVGARATVVLGHSLGGALATMIQSRACTQGRPHAGLAVLGWSPRWSSTSEFELEASATVDESRRAVHATLVAADPRLWSSDPVHFPFHANFAFARDVTPAARTAAELLQIGVPRGLALDYGITPLATRAASGVRGKVLLASGDTDVSDDLDADAALFPLADVTTVSLPGSAHWHLFGGQRAALTTALGDWIDSLVDQTA